MLFFRTNEISGKTLARSTVKISQTCFQQIFSKFSETELAYLDQIFIHCL